MQEYRAAAALDARGIVVVDLDNEIVNMIVPPQSIAVTAALKPNRLVVMPAFRVFAPGIFRSDGTNRQECARPWVTIGAPPQLPWPERAPGGAAIAFALVGLDSAASKCDGHRLPASRQPALTWIAGSGANPYHRKRPGM